MTTSESAFINDIKEIARREATADGRRKAARARFRQAEREIERRYRGQPNADSRRHCERSEAIQSRFTTRRIASSLRSSQ